MKRQDTSMTPAVIYIQLRLSVTWLRNIYNAGALNCFSSEVKWSLLTDGAPIQFRCLAKANRETFPAFCPKNHHKSQHILFVTYVMGLQIGMWLLSGRKMFWFFLLYNFFFFTKTKKCGVNLDSAEFGLSFFLWHEERRGETWSDEMKSKLI